MRNHHLHDWDSLKDSRLAVMSLLWQVKTTRCNEGRQDKDEGSQQRVFGPSPLPLADLHCETFTLVNVDALVLAPLIRFVRFQFLVRSVGAREYETKLKNRRAVGIPK